jgi:hypothetical protein
MRFWSRRPLTSISSLAKGKDERWVNVPVSGLDGSLPLEFFGFSIPLAAVYRGVKLAAVSSD